MKDYNTETDVIITPDPLYYPGDQVMWRRSRNNGYNLFVESFSWSTLDASWTYTLVYFPSEEGSIGNLNGSLAEDAALEEDLSLFSRQQKTVSARKAIGK